ncbi:hypothetical protein B0A49_12596 [Cryomyces minteri]|uniref:Uncharacterized protein n=1 Tax=Cryomyces minteri TaxID=331657 RepID=A0A4U0WHY6_9PEZI|nr:hypothetical protein B0A49_12596 [Cryomyces minteri]
MPGRLHDKAALVTGSSSGLGRAIALAYASEGAQICCVDLYPSPRNATNASTGKADSFHNRLPSSESTHAELLRLYPVSSAIFVQADVTDAKEMEQAVARCVEAFGRLDVMVNNAGISVESTHVRMLRVHETSEEDWDRTMAINAKGVFLGCKYAIAQMLRQERREGERDMGWIVNTASVQGLVAYYGTLLKTTMTQNLQNDPVLRQKTDDAHPFGGMGDVEDVARAAVFLASDDARWVTGVPLPVDGGLLTL